MASRTFNDACENHHDHGDHNHHGAPETVVHWPVTMTTITYTWTRLKDNVTTTETYRFAEAIITVTLPDHIIEYYVTCVLPLETATVTTTETVATWTITIYTHTHTIGWRTIIPGGDD